jgi:hypothetical protein
MTVY